MIFDPRRVVLGQVQVERAEGRHGPPDADRTIQSVRDERAELVPEDPLDELPDDSQLRLGRRITAHETLREPDASQLQADDLVSFLSFAGDDLGAAAADVHDHRALGLGIQSGENGEKYEPGFFLAGEYVHRVPDPLREAGRN